MKKMGFFRRMAQNNKMKIIFCLVSMAMIFLMYIPAKHIVKQEASLNKMTSLDFSIYTDVVACNLNSGELSVSGWAINAGNDVKDISVFLRPTKGNEKLMKTTLLDSEEAEEYAKYLDLTNSSQKFGFVANIKEGKLKENISYAILLRIVYETESGIKEKIISTSKYLYNEKLYSYRPEETQLPDIENEEIARAMTEGILYAYSAENRAWVFQYNNCLYWVLDSSIEKNRDENLYMYVHLYTSKDEFLSENRKQAGYENWDFFFSKREITLNENKQYRVAKVELSTSMPITYISIGHYVVETRTSHWSRIFQYVKNY